MSDLEGLDQAALRAKLDEATAYEDRSRIRRALRKLLKESGMEVYRRPGKEVYRSPGKHSLGVQHRFTQSTFPPSDSGDNSVVQFMWQPLTEMSYPRVTLIASFKPGSVDLSLDLTGGHYISEHVTIPKGTYEGQLVVGNTFVHPVQRFTIDSDGIVVLQFQPSHSQEGQDRISPVNQPQSILSRSAQAPVMQETSTQRTHSDKYIQDRDVAKVDAEGTNEQLQHINETSESNGQLHDRMSQLRKKKDVQIQQLQQQLSDMRREKEGEVHQLQQSLSETTQQLSVLRREREVQIQQLQQGLSDIRREKEGEVHQLQQNLSETTQQLSDLRRERYVQVQQFQHQLSDVRREKEVQIRHLQQSLSETAQQLSDVRREKDEVQQRLATTLSHSHSQEIEFWRVSPEEVQVDQDVLGGGAWGYVAKGKFRGQRVAVKRVYPSILQPTTVDRIRREISTMAQVRHPNLVLFIAAVLDDRTGPMIITEILDASLRTVYEENQLGSNKLRVFRDVASALNYLHRHRQPIIHRDVSSANVLLEAVANDVWKAKLSDFGSANLVRFATTPGEGAIIYTAPEAFPQHPRSRTPPPPQTPKIDVYSYGVLVGEVVIQELPDPDRLQEMVQQVRRQWPQIHPLVTSSIEYSPDDRPTMAYILEELEKLTP